MNPKVAATASFDRSMVKNLATYFDDYAVDGVVEIEVTDHGLWFVNPNGSRQFLGSTKIFPVSATKQ
jgi:hypothetical protein